MTAGWYWVYSYEQGQCLSEVFAATAFATGVCIQATETTSFRIDCTTTNSVTTCVENYYSTLTCDGPIVGTDSAKFGCVDAGDTNSYLYGFTNGTNSISSILPPNGKTYAVATFYSDSGCQSLVAFDGTIVNQCASDTAFSSLYVQYPTQMKYNESTTCTGTVKELSYVETCSPSLQNGTSFMFVNSMVVNATFIKEDDDVKTDHRFDFTNGAIVGIVLGAVFFAALLIGLRYFMVYYRNKKTESLLRDKFLSDDRRM